MNKPKILIAVGHGLYEPWIDILHEEQRKTWLRWPYLRERIREFM
jgi:hypothetical protein